MITARINTKELKLFKCSPGETIVSAMKRIDKNSYGILYVVDRLGTVVGCITDGDIRRWIIKGGSVKTTVREAMNTAPVCVVEENREDGRRMMSERYIPSVAVIDEKRCLVDVMFATPKEKDHRSNILSGTSVIVMAGGKGARLYPYTKILPKPLIPVGDVPILERILNRFHQYGVKEFYITVNYRKEMIKSYFAEATYDYTIHYVEENEPLGTAGSIGLIEKRFSGPVIVTNCDILIDCDYGDVIRHHKKYDNDLTIVSSLKNTVIPYGVLHTKEDGIITDMEEKPEISCFVNTGMYVLNPGYIDLIPKGEMFHMTQLADLMIEKGKRVGMYPISEDSFLDMGEFSEMKRMEERVNAGFIK